MQSLLVPVIVSLTLAVCRAKDVRPHFDENYLVGMRAYTLEEWSSCTEKMQQAVEDFERYQPGSIKCLKQCESKQVSLFSTDVL